MDYFFNILQRDYGLKPQGKSAPMSVSSVKSTIPQSSSSLFSSSSSGKINRNSTESLSFGPAVGGILEEEDFLFGTSMTSKNGVKSASLNLDTFGSASAFDKTTGMSPIYDDVFGVKFSSSQIYQKPKQSASHHDDDIFEMQSNYHPQPVSSASKKPTDSSINVASSLPIFDGPLYDDDDNDIFGGLPGIKSTNVIYDDVFGGGGVPSSSVNASSSVFDDILGVPKDRASNTRSVAEPSAPLVDFDDLLPGFGGSEPAKSRYVTFDDFFSTFYVLNMMSTVVIQCEQGLLMLIVVPFYAHNMISTLVKPCLGMLLDASLSTFPLCPNMMSTVVR